MKNISNKTARHMLLARQEFLSGGIVEEGLVAEAIERSWRRCLNNGIDFDAPNAAENITQYELALRQDKNHLLLQHAEPEMLTLCEQISHTRSIVILTDNEGIILRSMGDHSFASTAQRTSLSPGASWNEAHRGTNAIGTALIEQSAMTVQGAEHYMSHHHTLSCSAVPIFGANNQLLATLDVSNDLNTPQQHTLALVKMASQMIENRLFHALNSADITLHFHARPEFIGTLWEGIAMFSNDGQLVAVNRSGQFQLNIAMNQNGQSLQNIAFDYLFEISMKDLLKKISPDSALTFPIRLSNGARVYCRIELSHKTHVIKMPASNSKRTSAASLEMLDSNDPQISLAIRQVRQILKHDIPILIQGETGSGKELFARAIHEASTRSEGPWIAVNCAALPEGLIEAELFGYEEGAFTGAKRKGSPGKIEQAHGGTLFLDEIGDMPLTLQARLLRVLQERMVTPLGSTKSKPIDFSLISATNQKLKEKVNSFEFRSDLYYRINGLSITLPALRERNDLSTLIQYILQIEHVQPVEITAKAMEVFKNHPWPGNIRQLHNVIRTALALADGEPIDVMHFTKDFMDELISADLASTVNQGPVAVALKEITENTIEAAMKQHQGNISAVARQLKISRNTLYRRLRE